MEFNNKSEVNLLPTQIAAIATNKNIQQDIDALYYKHKTQAYEIAKKSIYYNHFLFTSGGIDRQIYCRRLLGIFLLGNKDDDIRSKFVEILISKKGWHNIYKYIKSYENKIEKLSFKKVLDDFRRLKILNPSLSTEVFNAQLILLITLGKAFELNIDSDDKGYRMFLDMLINITVDMSNRTYIASLKDATEEDLQKISSMTDRLINYLKINRLTVIEEIIEMGYEHPDIGNFTHAILAIIETENIDINLFSLEEDLSVEEIKLLMYIYYNTHKNQNRMDMAKLLLVGSIIKVILRDYKKVKQYYFENNKENLYLEMDLLESENKNLKKQIKIMESKNVILENENTRLMKEYKTGLEFENIELKKEIEILKQEIQENKQQQKELFALREVIFNLYNEDILEQEDEQLFSMPPVAAVIIGGHERWQRKMNEILPDSFKFVEGTKENFDTSILDNVKYLFLYTRAMNHATYFRAINYCKNKDIEIKYITSTSAGLVLKEISQMLTKI